MKLITWNINSVRLRIDLVKKLLKQERPDVLCLQETKCPNDAFPEKALRKMGYEHLAFHGQKGYHGVALVSRVPLADIETKQFCGKDDTRHIAATLPNGVRLHNFYVPAGGDEPDRAVNEKFDHKLNFLAEMADWFSRDASDGEAVLVGDLNIAPAPADVWSHKQLLNVVSHTPIEVEHLENVRLSRDWIDVARDLIPAPEPVYTWWSYRARDWRKSNRGRRLDHIWATPGLRRPATGGGAKAFKVLDAARDWEKPSDHAPVALSFDF